VKNAGVGAGGDDRRIRAFRAVAAELVDELGLELVLLHAGPAGAHGAAVGTDGDLGRLPHRAALVAALEQAHLVQQVVERDEIARRVAALALRVQRLDERQQLLIELVAADRVLKEFRGRFLGKSSPSHFWWGAFDLACTRFSGRPAPPHPGGIPNCPDYVTLEAYSHECSSVGWWPGNLGGLEKPAFYAYAYPQPPGYAAARIEPPSAYYHPTLREWILPYDSVRTAADPDAVLLAFCESTHAAAAELGGWDRAVLERTTAPLGIGRR